MINLLKSLFQIEPAPQKTMELQAKLLPINGAHLFGEAEYETYDNDGWELEAEVDFRNGERPSPLIMYLSGQPVLNLAPDHDESEGKLSSRRGDILGVTPKEGMPIEIKMAGQTVLSGKFERHPRFQ
ncbi:MAG: hypothetical protein AAFR82_02365 [Pseudomonadota bacterium]